MLDDHAKDFDSINYIYVVSDKGILKGALSIRDIFTNNDELIVKEVMATDLIKAQGRRKIRKRQLIWLCRKA
jgi:Mg/Co/Ni transporter MgtE